MYQHNCRPSSKTHMVRTNRGGFSLIITTYSLAEKRKGEKRKEKIDTVTLRAGVQFGIGTRRESGVNSIESSTEETEHVASLEIHEPQPFQIYST